MAGQNTGLILGGGLSLIICCLCVISSAVIAFLYMNGYFDSDEDKDEPTTGGTTTSGITTSGTTTGGTTTGTTQNNEVFHIKNYDFTKNQASTECAKYNNSVVATETQLIDAYNNGANWCSTGWLANIDDRKYPIQSVSIGCGGAPGIQTFNFKDSTNTDKAGINCYGKKPLLNDTNANNLLGFNQILWSKYDTGFLENKKYLMYGPWISVDGKTYIEISPENIRTQTDGKKVYLIIHDNNVKMVRSDGVAKKYGGEAITNFNYANWATYDDVSAGNYKVLECVNGYNISLKGKLPTDTSTKKTFMYGPWIGGNGQKYIEISAENIRSQTDGKKVYLIKQDNNVQMLRSDGVAKYYEGEINNFDYTKWDTYKDVPAGNYKVFHCPSTL
jgi:hypothetical protein